ncbi:MAG: BspA family leucine-rich repeat surface protein [Clostridia bacterium]|nr:BspA family leucine-rich repeat surface protein [Clostridia bacterium]
MENRERHFICKRCNSFNLESDKSCKKCGADLNLWGALELFDDDIRNLKPFELPVESVPQNPVTPNSASTAQPSPKPVAPTPPPRPAAPTPPPRPVAPTPPRPVAPTPRPAAPTPRPVAPSPVAPSPAPQPHKKSKAMIVIIICLVIAFLALGAAVVYNMGKDSTNKTPEKPQIDNPEEIPDDIPEEIPGADDSEADDELELVTVTTGSGYFGTNIPDDKVFYITFEDYINESVPLYVVNEDISMYAYESHGYYMVCFCCDGTISFFDINGLFSGLINLYEVDFNDAVIFDSSLTSLKGMFEGCSSLVEFNFGDVDFSNITDFSYMFKGCTSLESLTWGENAPKYGEYFVGIFEGCTSLKTVDLSYWDFSYAEDISRFFYNCSSLEEFYMDTDTIPDDVTEIDSLKGTPLE